MRNAEIVSCGGYVPEHIIQNEYFDKSLGQNVSEWLENVVHIKERRWCTKDECTSDLASKAAEQCLSRAGISADQLDLLIIATDTPDYVSPSTASVVQDKIKAINAGTFDINSACAGFVTALDIASKYIRADDAYEYILVIGAYAMSKHLNKQDKKTVTLFADGAGAILLKSRSDRNVGFLGSELRSMGHYNGWMGIYGSGTANPIDDANVSKKNHKLQFVKKFPKEINPKTWSDMALKLNQKTNHTSHEVDQYFITQLNINSIWETMDILKQPYKKAHTSMHNYGYTGSACIPLTYNDAWEKGMIKKGDLIYFIGSGGGLAFASAAFKL